MGGLAGFVRERPTPENFENSLTQAVSYGLMTPAQKQETIAKYGGSPESIRAYADQSFQSALTAKDRTANETRIQAANISAAPGHRQAAVAEQGSWSNVIVGRRVLQQNNRTGEIREAQDPYSDTGGTVTVGPISNLPETQAGGGGVSTAAKPNVLAANVGATSPNAPVGNGLINTPAVATAPAPRTRPPVTNPLMVEEKPVWNEKAGVWMTPPTAENPQGKVVDTPEVKKIVQTRAANETLKVAGFNQQTGSDEISDLIKKSTSGLGENWANKAWGAISGTGSTGAEAIAKLETRAHEMTLGLAPNGSLGAGFSNEDREFMLRKLGDVANPNTPMNVRLAAWEDVMERAAKTANVPYRKSFSSSAAAAPSTALPKGFKLD